jgi:hypothetical protein
MMETKSTSKCSRITTSDREESSASLCERARRVWLSGSDHASMKKVEGLYRRVWLRNESPPTNSAQVSSGDDPHFKKPRLEAASISKDDSDCWRLQAGEKLALILLQSGRAQEADQILASLGYTCRLAASVLNYDTQMTVAAVVPNDDDKKDIPCCVYDDFLSDAELQMLQTVFLDPANSYWTDHNYTVEPPSPYFSYLIPLRNGESMDGGVAAFVHRLQDFLKPHFPVQNYTYCEMWAHNRPHATGHQFHFDSDNEGCTETIRNPICSCVVYLTDDAGGPSVVTNQRLASRNLATAGWICRAAKGRMVAFDGKVLHGVVPGKACIKQQNSEPNSNRRVSVMFAFWRKIRVRDSESGPGAARPFPIQPLWAQQLRKPVESNAISPTPIAGKPIPLDHVYESTLTGTPWTRKMGLPGYEQIFQGF